MAWPTDYDALPANHVDNVNEVIAALHVNRLDAAINALQATLGTTPQGIYPTVKARLDATTGAAIPAGIDEGDVLVGGVSDLPVWAPKGADYNLLSGLGSGIVTGSVSAGQAATNMSAINAVLAAAAAQGRPVLFPPVTIEFVAAIRFPSNTYIRGFGKGRSIWKVHSSVGVGAELIGPVSGTTGADNVTFENFEIDGNRVARGFPTFYNSNGTVNPGTGTVVFRSQGANTCDNIRIHRMAIHDCVGVALSAKAVNGWYITNNEIYNTNRDGCSVITEADITTCKNIYIIGNKITGCGDDAIAVTAMMSSGASIENVVIANNLLGDQPAYVPNGPGTGATSWGGHGVCLAGVRNATVTGNVITRAGTGGIQISTGYFDTNPADCTNIVIDSNVIYQPGSPYGGIPESASGWGVEVTQKFDGGLIYHLEISNNLIDRPSSHGIYLAEWGTNGAVDHVRIIGNKMIGGGGGSASLPPFSPTQAGVFVEDAMTQIDILDNKIMDFRGQAITFNSQASSYVHIANNRIFSPNRATPGSTTVTAIDITNVGQVTLNNNKVIDLQASKGSGYALGWGGASNVRMFNNDFLSSANTGTFTGAVGSNRQSHNINNAGTLYYTIATSGGYATGDMVS